MSRRRVRSAAYRALILGLCIACCACGAGVPGRFDNQGTVECSDGRTLDLREWTPYAAVGGPNWLVNKKTGETIIDDKGVKCWPKP
jgi:hypothetical protein